MARWQLIKDGYPYHISDEGDVKSEGFVVRCRGGFRNTGEKILKPYVRNGYKSVRLNIDSIKFKWYTVHRLVASAFCQRSEGLDQVNHIDGNRQNNHYSNLEWCTQSWNTKHAYLIGALVPPGNRKGFVGAKNPSSKPVIQYDVAMNIVDEHESISLTKTKGFIPACVGKACKGMLKQHKGFIWRYKAAG